MGESGGTWFAETAQNRIRRGSFERVLESGESDPGLSSDTDAKPFVWAADADRFREKIQTLVDEYLTH